MGRVSRALSSYKQHLELDFLGRSSLLIHCSYRTTTSIMTFSTRPSTPNSSYSHQIPHRRLREVQKESQHREKRSKSVYRGVKKASDRLQGITSNEEGGGNGEFRFIPARVDRQHLNKGGLSQSLLPSPTISQNIFTPSKSKPSSRKAETPIESKKDVFSFHSFALPSPSSLREAESQSLSKSYHELSSPNLKYHKTFLSSLPNSTNR